MFHSVGADLQRAGPVDFEPEMGSMAASQSIRRTESSDNLNEKEGDTIDQKGVIAPQQTEVR